RRRDNAMSLALAYLIQYGRPGFVGRFRSALVLARGERAVVRGLRGVEFGEVLVPIDGPGDDGEGLRVPTADDESEASTRNTRGQELLAAAIAGADERGLSLTFADVEVTLDGTAILHALPWDACDATELLDALAAAFGFTVRLFDLARAAVAPEPAE